jgi:hypothetical protein
MITKGFSWANASAKPTNKLEYTKDLRFIATLLREGLEGTTYHRPGPWASTSGDRGEGP